jgi:hypothetical protein
MNRRHLWRLTLDNRSQTYIEIPTTFRRLPMPMPPMLPIVVGIKGDSRFFYLSYEGTKAFWFDGRASASFSFFAGYEPYINHLAMAIHLLNVHLGSDDKPPLDALLVDRETAAVYVGEYSEVCRFVSSQHAPQQLPTPQEIEEIKKSLSEMVQRSLDDLREYGAFEFILGPKLEQQIRCSEMVTWLDEFIDDDLINSYLTALNAGNLDVIPHLLKFEQRVTLLLDKRRQFIRH